MAFVRESQNTFWEVNIDFLYVVERFSVLKMIHYICFLRRYLSNNVVYLIFNLTLYVKKVKFSHNRPVQAQRVLGS